MSKNDHIVQRLADLLNQERELLLSGALDAVVALTPEKEALMTALREGAPQPSDGLTALVARAERNGALFEAALAGLRSASERLTELKRLRSGFETYDEAGHRQQHAQGRPGRLEKRA